MSDDVVAPEVSELGMRAPNEALEPHGPVVVDNIAVARLYGEPLFSMPTDLYIPPDALQLFLEAFEGPLDLLLYLIRKQNFNILDIPMASVTRQYLAYVELFTPIFNAKGEITGFDSLFFGRKTRVQSWCAGSSSTSR